MKGNALIACLLFIAVSVQGLRVIEPEEFAGYYNSPWIDRYGKNIDTSAPVRARLVGTFTDKAGPTEGSIMLGCNIGVGTTEQQIRSQLSKGIIGYLNCAKFSRFPGLINRLRDGSDISDITIPVWDVGYLDFLDVINYMQSNNTNITVIVEMDYDDPSAWEAVYATPAYPIYSAVLGAYALAVAILAAYKLSTYMKAFGAQATIPQICLWIEIFGNLERVVYHTVDPLWSRFVFPLMAGHILLTISVPVFSTTSLLITLYWKELLSSRQTKAISFLKRMQIPFYVIVSVIWAFEFVLGILRGVGQGPIGTLTVVISVFYGVVALFTSIFFIHYGRKLMATLQSAKSRVEQQKRSKSKFQAIRMLMASAGLELAYVILLGFSATEYFYYPWGLWSANLISTLLLISISLVQVLAFTLPIAKPRSSKSASGTTKSTGRTPSAPSLNMDTIQSSRTNPTISLSPSTARSEKMASGDDDVERGQNASISPKVDLIVEESSESDNDKNRSNESEESSESEASEDNDSDDSSNDE
jgi:hypothetical protein